MENICWGGVGATDCIMAPGANTKKNAGTILIAALRELALITEAPPRPRNSATATSAGSGLIATKVIE